MPVEPSSVPQVVSSDVREGKQFSMRQSNTLKGG
jgi:hypothetical protein